MRAMGAMEQPTPSNPVEFYSHGNDPYRGRILELCELARYRYGQLSKMESAGRLTKMIPAMKKIFETPWIGLIF